MNISQIFNIALKNMHINRARFWQSMLGFIIAVAAIFTILCVGQGMLKRIDGIYQQYSRDMVFVSVFMRAESKQSFNEMDLLRVIEADKDLYDAFTPFVPLVNDNLRYGNMVYDETGIIGVSDEYLATMPVLQLAEGRFLQTMDIEREQKVCVVGNYVAEKVLDNNALGSKIKIRGENYTVIGVLQAVPVVGEDWNKVAYIPFTNARKLAGSGFVSYSSGNYYKSDYYIKASSMENVKLLRQSIWDNLEKAYGDNQITYVHALSREQENSVAGIYMTLSQSLLFVVIVLLIGCVGIMNMMLAVVSSRTKEIAIRKTFGANNKDIRRQFLLESGCTGIIGGLLGIFLGLISSYLVCNLIQLPVNLVGVPLGPILVSLLVSVALGIISGTYPANQAAKMEPVVALCH